MKIVKNHVSWSTGGIEKLLPGPYVNYPMPHNGAFRIRVLKTKIGHLFSVLFIKIWTQIFKTFFHYDLISTPIVNSGQKIVSEIISDVDNCEVIETIDNLRIDLTSEVDYKEEINSPDWFGYMRIDKED